MKATKCEIERFDGDGDFSLWKRRMFAFLSVSGLKDVLEEKTKIDETKDEDKDPEAKKKEIEAETARSERCEKAMNIIFLNVGDHVLRKIERCTTAAETWMLLEKLYMPKSLPNRVHAQLKLYSFKMQDSRSIDENIDDFLKLIGELSHLSIEVAEEVQAILMLNSLPSKYDQLKETLKYGREVIKVDEVASSARSKEKELKESSGSRTSSEGYFVRGRSDNRGSQNSGGKYKGNRARSKSTERKKICWICGKEGHYKKQCYKWLEKNKHKLQSTERGESSHARDDAQDLAGLIAHEVNVGQGDDQDDWIMDTGCSFHMTPKLEYFIEIKEASGGRVRMANGHIVEVKGIGSIRFQNPDGTTFVLHEVRYMPDIARNLISLGTLEDKGCEFKGSRGQLKIIKGCTVIMKGERRGADTLYFLVGRARTGEACVSNTEVFKSTSESISETKLWHSRLGHISQKGLEVLVKKGCIPREQITELKFCEDCVLGKTHRVSFGPAQHVTKNKLDYVHSDLWGSPNVPQSLGRCHYFISFTDDWSRKVWVYFLKTKDEAFDKFVEWKTMVEVQAERKLKKLRTDNGLEFCNQRFDKLCKEEGVVRHKNCAYTPQQNGVAERLNRSILNKVRSMLSESGLGQKFWAEAVSTAVYQINRSPSSVIEFEIPEERWTSAIPDLSGLRRFGCIVYIHASEGKLNPRAKKGVFTGYPDGVKGFRVWVLDDQRCEISRNVLFREDVMFKDTQSAGNSGMNNINYFDINRFSSFDVSGPRLAEEAQDRGGPTEDGEEPDKETAEEVVEGTESEQSRYQLARDRPRRVIKPPSKLQDYHVYPEDESIAGFAYLMVEDGERPEPRNYQEAMEDPDSDKWTEASDEEMGSLKKNQTWVLVDRPKNQKPIGCRWVYKRKPGIDGVEDPRYKSRLVAKGYSQKQGIDYTEIFSPVVKHVSIRLLLSAVVHLDMELHQMDVKTAFLHGFLDETIYMEQPEGYVDKTHPEKVCLLKKSLYGLKQSPRQWNNRFDTFMQKNLYVRSEFDNCVYFKEVKKDEFIYLLLYVDDILIASKNKHSVLELKTLLGTEFEMKDLGETKKILGMEIARDRVKGCLSISQEGYLSKVLGTYGMDQSNSVGTPMGVHFKLKAATEKEIADQTEKMESVPYRSVVGSVMYAMIGTRLDLAFAVGLVCRYMSNPIKEHWLAAKWILRYIRGTIDMKLCYRNEGDFIVKGYVDADYAGDMDKRRSTTGMVFTVGGNPVSWRSSLQDVVALSSTESEYIALSEASKEAVWLRGLMNELGFDQGAVSVYCDSQSAIALAKNAVFHGRTKHMQVKYHFIRDLIAEGWVNVVKISTVYNPADIFTKVLPIGKFKEALNLLRVRRN